MRCSLWVLPMVILAQAGPAEPPVEESVLRFDPDLVRIDAVATGRDGRRVEGLAAADFEVLQDGRRQKITQFSYTGGGDQPKPAPRIAIVVDDIDLSLDDHTAIRGALARFVDQELPPATSLSLVCTSHGSGALRRFTADPQSMHRAIDDMYWRPAGGLRIAFPEMSLLRDLGNIVAELGAFPGRKSLVVIAPRANTQMTDARGIADMAARASVTIHGVDAQTHSRSAAGDTLGLLASATGGRFHNSLSAALDVLREAALDSSAYYLIGWNPGADAFRADPNRETQYHRVQIRARDNSLHVRARDGFFSRTGAAIPGQVIPGADPVRDALESTFHSGEIEVRLTADFQRQEAAGSYVTSLLHIAPQGVLFSPDKEGCWSARVEIARAIRAVDPGMPLNDRVNSQPLDIHSCGKEAERLMADGLVAAVEDRVPTPGAYQVRVAVRVATAEPASSDGHSAATRPIGSAAQFLVIPDLRTAALALSGITLWSGEAPAPATADPVYRAAEGADPAVRRFAEGTPIHYSVRALGGAPAPVSVLLRILRDGHEVAGLPAAPLTGKLPVAGLPPGAYVLGVTASSQAARKGGHAEQWIDFQIR